MSSFRDKFRHRHDEMVGYVSTNFKKLAEIVTSLLFSPATTSTMDI